MDSHIESMENNRQNEVILNFAQCPSPEITITSPSLNKPPKPPKTIPIRLKSRFEEPFTISNPVPESQKPPKEENEDEKEEEDVFKKEELEEGTSKAPMWCKAILFEWIILALSILLLVASLVVDKWKGHKIWGLDIWKWCLMITVTCCGHMVSCWFVKIVVFIMERNYLLRTNVLYFVYGLRYSFQVFIWLVLILVSWLLVFNTVRRSEHTRKVLHYVTRFLIAMVVGSVIWLVKTFLIKMVASSFHMDRFFDRIQESVFHQHILQTLSGRPLMSSAEKIKPVKTASGRISFGKKEKDKKKLDVAKLYKMRQEKMSAWTMRGLVNMISTSGLSTSPNETFEDPGENMEINSEKDARLAAYRIFKNVARPGYNFIDAIDLLNFLSKEEAEYVLPLFEGASDTGKIKKSALKNWVVKAYLERKALAHSLNDTKTAVDEMSKLFTVIVIVAILIITLILLGIATTQVLVFISSQLLLVGFMFGNSCKTAFEAIIFVFVMHPFDVGDRCIIDGVQMTVEQMNILTTVFLKFDNTKIYYPNSVLSTKPIGNFYRSPDMSDSVEFDVHISTSAETIGTLKARIKMYLESKPTHWHPTHSVVVKGIENVNKLLIALYVNHTINFQKVTEKNSRRSDLVMELKRIFNELSIQYQLLPREVHFSYAGTGPLPLAISNQNHLE